MRVVLNPGVCACSVVTRLAGQRPIAELEACNIFTVEAGRANCRRFPAADSGRVHCTSTVRRS